MLTSGRPWIKILEILLVQISLSYCDDQEFRLLKYLMKEYDPSVRPVAHFSHTLNVTFSMSLHHIIDVDEKNQILTTNCWLTQVWTDNHLRWNDTEFGGIKVIRIPYMRIWKPDTILYNNADSQYSSSVINTNVIVTYAGEVTWLSHGIFKSSCDINVEYFPFDIQNCSLKWASWTYDGYQVDLQITENEGDLTNFHSNGEFDLISFLATRNEVQYSCCPEPYPDITFTISLKRRHFFYVFNLIIPCCLINGIALLVFFVPSDSGEKVTLGISALLSMTVFLMTIRESLPPTEKTPLIGIYYGVSICIVTSASAMAVITLNIHHRGVRSLPVPKLVKFLTRACSRLLLIQKDPISEARSEYDGETSETDLSLQLNELRPALGHRLDPQSTSRKCDYLDRVGMSPPRNHDPRKRRLHPFYSLLENDEFGTKLFGVLDKLLRSIEKCEKRARDQLKQEGVELEWKKVAYVCDRLLFWVFTICTLVASALILNSSPYGP